MNEKEGRKRDGAPQSRTSCGDIWKVALSPFAFVKNWLCVNAAGEGLQRRTEMMKEGMDL